MFRNTYIIHTHILYMYINIILYILNPDESVSRLTRLCYNLYNTRAEKKWYRWVYFLVFRGSCRDENKRKIMIIRRGREIRDNKSNKLIDGKRAENCCEKMRHLMPLNRCSFLRCTEIRNYRDIYRPSVANIV